MSDSRQTSRVALTGLEFAAPQVWGGVRLVPLLRPHHGQDLRLHRRAFNEGVAVVDLPDKSEYYAYVPHALVAAWTKDGSAATFGTQFEQRRTKTRKDGRREDWGLCTARVMSRMRAREAPGRLRFLPFHIAFEGMLARHFGGPNVAWEEYSRAALSSGVGIRTESAVPGRQIVGLEDALRVFEIHENQVGTVVFVADSLAAVFVVPHPQDYRALHRTLLTDCYGELIYQYSQFAGETEILPAAIGSRPVASIQQLRAELVRYQNDLMALHEKMLVQFRERDVQWEPVYQMGPFALRRFISELEPGTENYVGEAIYRNDGTLEYLKTYRMSAAQSRRAYLLEQLARHDWHIARCAEHFGCSHSELVLRLENAAFGYMLHQHVLDRARAIRRKGSST